MAQMLEHQEQEEFGSSLIGCEFKSRFARTEGA